MRCSQTKMKGVTLMEILIVVAIIGILSGIAIPNFIGIVRNNRVRARAIGLVNVLRNERARAISLQREIQVTIDKDNKTYSVQQLEYTLHDPLSADLDAPDILSEEDAKDLVVSMPFDESDWLDHETEPVAIYPDPFTVIFKPSGIIEMTGGAIIATVSLKGKRLGFEIELYKGGQIKLIGY